MYSKCSSSSNVFSVQATRLRYWRSIGRYWPLDVVHDQPQNRLQAGKLAEFAVLASLPFLAPGASVRGKTADEGCFVQTWCDFVWTSHTRRFGWWHDIASKSDGWHRIYYAGFGKAHKQERLAFSLLQFDLV
jgi:hypothetical protein